MAISFASSLCAQYRRNGASCRACFEACPHGALVIADGVKISAEKCTDCGLCAAVCPNEALRGAGEDLDLAIDRLKGRKEPVLGCRQQLASTGDARVRCFGGLATGDLVALAFGVGGNLKLNIAACRACPAGPAVLPVLKQRLDDISGHIEFPRGITLGLQEEFGTGPQSREGASRRGFLQFFGRLAFVAGEDDPCGGSSVSRRERIRMVAGELTPDASEWLLEPIDFVPVKTESCNDCCRCARTCPTGALTRKRIDGDKLLNIDATACTGCGVCMDLCPCSGIVVYSRAEAVTASAGMEREGWMGGEPHRV